MENMWQFNVEEINEESPKAILEEQAKLLPSLTGDMVYASVKEEDWINYPIDFKRDFLYSFNLKSKFLPNYNFEIFSLSHNIPIFPVKISMDDEVKKELNIRDILHSTVQNESEFRDLLRKILSSKRIGSVVSSIIKLSK